MGKPRAIPAVRPQQIEPSVIGDPVGADLDAILVQQCEALDRRDPQSDDPAHGRVPPQGERRPGSIPPKTSSSPNATSSAGTSSPPSCGSATCVPPMTARIAPNHACQPTPPPV